jgi:flagellar operon protein
MIHRVVTAATVPINGTEQNITFVKELETQRQNSFIQLLQDKMTPDAVSFSAHALSRLEQRNIVVDEQIKSQLETAIDKIAQKGGRESLIMLDDLAFLVSIPNKKVITALEASEDNVFTNIDSAVLM